MIGTMLVVTSVGQSSKSTGTRSGRYRPNRSKTFVDWLQTAKREKEDLKIKSVDSSTAYNRLTYIVVNNSSCAQPPSPPPTSTPRADLGH